MSAKLPAWKLWRYFIPRRVYFTPRGRVTAALRFFPDAGGFDAVPDLTADACGLAAEPCCWVAAPWGLAAEPLGLVTGPWGLAAELWGLATKPCDLAAEP